MEDKGQKEGKRRESAEDWRREGKKERGRNLEKSRKEVERVGKDRRIKEGKGK